MLSGFLSVLISFVAFTVASGQLYGVYNCGNGNNNYCGPNPPACTDAQNQAALLAFQSYYANLGNSTNYYAASTAYTTGDGNGGDIPPFQFNWYGSPSLIPIAGTYTGSMALSQFFTIVNEDVKDFTYNTLFEPNNGGVLVAAYNCQFLIAQWQEMSTVIATNKAITYATNTVRYTFLNYSYPAIAVADVFVNDGQYQNAFCPGQVNCNGYSNDDDGVSVSTQNVSISVLAILIVLFLEFQFMFFQIVSNYFGGKKPLASATSSSSSESKL